VSNPPVFILSCERSGSTMLRYILDTHSKIASPGHLYLGALCENLNRVFLSTIAQNLVGFNDDEKKQFSIMETRQAILDLMSKYVSGKGKEIWCEKSPGNLDYLPLLTSHFPEAKYICLYRHCMDVVSSSLQMNKYRFLPEHIPYVHRNPGNIVSAMVENWIDKTCRMLDFESLNSENSFRIRYEDIVLNSSETLVNLFNFLGVDWEDGLVERVFNIAHDGGEGDGKATLSGNISKASIGKGKEVPKSLIQDEFLIKINEILFELGYMGLDDYYKNYSRNALIFDKNTNDVKDVNDVIELRFSSAIKKNRARCTSVCGIWKIIANGKENEVWTIDFSVPDVVINREDAAADYIISLTAQLLLDMVTGARDPVEAFMQNEIEVSGIDSNQKLIDFARLIFS